MAVNINVPSQVKTYANLAAFPATGALKTIYIAEDTNKTYRWTGSVYTEISASAAMTWGAIGGTLSNQTDLQNALDAKVPTSRTLTINGVTQDLSANRTFTISTGITIGSTAIASGVVGRVLFEGAGNVVQESSSLTWDATNNRLGIGTSTPAFGLDVVGTARVSGILSTPSGLDLAGWYLYASGTSNATLFGGSSWVFDTVAGGGYRFRTAGNTDRLRIESTGNVLIGTTTDAGFRLDVNGTARVQGQLTTTGRVAINGTTLIANAAMQVNGTNQFVNYNTSFSSGSFYTYQAFGAWEAVGSDAATGTILAFGGYRSSQWTGITFHSSGSERMRIPTSGNVLINTTTDAGFRLDVNGTAIIRGDFNVGGSAQSGYQFRLTNSAYIGGQLRVDGNTTINATVTVVGVTVLTGGRTVVRDGNSLLVGGSSGSDTPDASALTEIRTTTKGFLPPRMTTTQKNAIATPAAGLMVYDTTLNVISYYNGTMWI